MLAKEIAVLLRDGKYNYLIHRMIENSKLRENSVALNDFFEQRLDSPNSKTAGEKLAEAMNTSVAELKANLGVFSEPIGLFYPVSKHREAAIQAFRRVSDRPEETAVSNYLVAWDPYWLNESEIDNINAYDPGGNKVILSFETPPKVPVLVLSPENLRDIAPTVPCTFDCGGGSGGNGGGGTGGGCPSGNTSYFVVTAVKIDDDHENWLRGSPEFEIYDADYEGNGKNDTNPTTKFILDGNSHTDASGYSFTLPDVNSTGTWYSLGCGFAVKRTSNANLGIIGFEDDDTKGELKLTDLSAVAIGFSCSTNNTVTGCLPWTNGWLKIAKAALGSGDDRYDKPIRFTGQSSSVIEVNGGDWHIKWQIQNR